MRGQSNVNLDQKRWSVLIASCIINLCIGSLYAWSVFVNPMVEKLNTLYGLGITAAGLAIVFTVANSVGPITMISGGYVNDRLGAQKVVFVGGLLFGGGLLLSGFAFNVPFLILSYGLGCGLGMGMVYGVTINNSVKFFPERRGLIGGIATATYGLSSVIVPPIANKMIQALGISNTFLVLGILCIIFICGGSFFIITCPQGYCPKGYDFVTNRNIETKGMEKNWKEMLRTKEFYIMLLILLCGAFSGLMIISQVSLMAQTITGMSVSLAAVAVSMLAFFNASGRVVAGSLSDKLGRSNVLLITFVLEIIGLSGLRFCGSGDIALFFVSVSIIGICFGSLMGIYPGFTADQFGSRNNSMNYGIMFIGFALAGLLGPTTAGHMYACYEDYRLAFYLAMALAMVGLIMTICFQKAENRK